MKILLLGATGFIGNSLFHRLVMEHDVIIAGRTPIDGYETNYRYLDFSIAFDPKPILEDIELLINATGIIEGDYEKVHSEGPLQLLQECAKKKIKVIQISAIGAEKEKPPTQFLQSKKIVDDYLSGVPSAKVIYPGIVIGKKGKSTRFFKEISALPIIPFLKEVYPPLVHISQLTGLIQDIITNFDKYPKTVFAISESESFLHLLRTMRGKLAFFIPVPIVLLKLFFILFPFAKIGIFSKDMFNMLLSISSKDYQPNFPKMSIHIQPTQLEDSKYIPELLSILSISFIWIWSGISSLISWEHSILLMKEVGAAEPFSTLSIYAGSLVDIFLGIAIFNKKYRKSILVFQIFFIIAYSIILSIFAPHYWLHPFGVLSKNIPLIALSIYLYKAYSY